MLRAASAATLALACVAVPARGQGPRSATLERTPPPEWTLQKPSRLPGRSASPLAWPPDSVTIPRTYWLEGGVIGGVVLGFLGSGLCQIGDHSSVGCYAAVFFFVGGGIGFPTGALIGGLFPKT